MPKAFSFCGWRVGERHVCNAMGCNRFPLTINDGQGGCWLEAWHLRCSQPQHSRGVPVTVLALRFAQRLGFVMPELHSRDMSEVWKFGHRGAEDTFGRARWLPDPSGPKRWGQLPSCKILNACPQKQRCRGTRCKANQTRQKALVKPRHESLQSEVQSEEGAPITQDYSNMSVAAPRIGKQVTSGMCKLEVNPAGL